MATSKNEITGDLISSGLTTNEYRNNYDSIFRKDLKSVVQYVIDSKESKNEKAFIISNSLPIDD